MEKEILLNWLVNAYSMELGMMKLLEKHKSEATDHFQVVEIIDGHIIETGKQAKLVKAEIVRLGGDVSALKAWRAEAFGWWHGVISGVFEDKLVRNAIAELASEQFEIAVYKAIAKAGEMEGDTRVEEMAEKIMRQEAEMAKKLDKMLGGIVEMYYREKKQETTAGV